MLFLLCSVLLSSTAGADVLPFARPSLDIRVINAPDEPLCLDLLAEAELEDVSWGLNASNAYIDQLKTLEGDGWLLAHTTGHDAGPVHGSIAPGSDGMWHFSYILPGRFRIAAATADTAQATAQVYDLDTFHGTIVYDWAANAVVSFNSHALYFVGQFLITLLATLLIEGVVLYLFGFREKRTWKVFFIVNIMTQLGLHALCSNAAASASFTGSPFPLLLPELVIFAVEAFAFSHYMEESTGRRRRWCALTANLVSYLSSVVLLRLLSPLLLL